MKLGNEVRTVRFTHAKDSAVSELIANLAEDQQHHNALAGSVVSMAPRWAGSMVFPVPPWRRDLIW